MDHPGAGMNRRGSIEVAVTIMNDKITDVEISNFRMHYSESDVVGLPQEVLDKQSTQLINVTGATYSTNAFEDAVQDALSQALNKMRWKMRKTKLYMDTVVDIQVVTKESKNQAEDQIDRAFEAFYKVEQACSRFNQESELMMACLQIETWIPISPYVFEPLRFALEMAKWTNGLFDPTVGKTMETIGFNRHYLTGQLIQSPSANSVTYLDIILNEQEQTLYFKKPLVIDLGAVAKGFAIDLAAHELKGFAGFLVNAGGDLFAGGLDMDSNPWTIGIQHPVHKEQIIHKIDISNQAVCTSGSYERKSTKVAGMHHIINPYTNFSPEDWVSCSVIAPFAMLADAFSTALFLMDMDKGKTLIEQADLKAIMITAELQLEKVGGI